MFPSSAPLPSASSSSASPPSALDPTPNARRASLALPDEDDPDDDIPLLHHELHPTASAHATSSDALDPRSSPATTRPDSSPADDIEMEPMKGAGHRRRRSSLMQSVGSINLDRTSRPRAPSLRNGNAGLPEESKIDEDTPENLPSSSADPEADDSFSDEDLHDDEETGLTKKDKRRKDQKKRRNTQLDQRIARGGDITAEEKKEADQNVVKKLVINASLILLWYIFSLSISLVSSSFTWPRDNRRPMAYRP